jgi:hypothetical protein
MSANTLLFISCAGQIAFIPVIAGVRDPRDFRKALYVCMGFVGSVYVAFSLTSNIFSAQIIFLESSSLTRM